jgi:plasmid stabilization system protein ParE
MPLVYTTPEADQQIRAIERWWKSNRRAAPRLFQEELAEAFSVLATSPGIGRIYRTPSVAGVRRLLLRATRYHVYYVHDADAVIVLSVWSAVRGRDPKLHPP